MFRFIGTVRPGVGEGKKIGYPTANLEQITPHCDLPPGVYAARVKVDPTSNNDRVTQVGSVIIGARHSNPPLVEVYVFDWDDDIYGKQVLVEVHKKVSDIQAFKNSGALKEKIRADVDKIKRIMN